MCKWRILAYAVVFDINFVNAWLAKDRAIIVLSAFQAGVMFAMLLDLENAVRGDRRVTKEER